MKKSIKTLVSRMRESDSGSLQGGFGQLRGGTALKVADNDIKCSNTHTCSGTNSGVCDNSGDCGDATNTSPTNCTNSGTCFV